MPDNIFQIGLGKIIVSRRIGSQVAAGVFLVDTGCLGIKNAFLTISSPLEFQSIVDRIRERTELVSVKAEYARKLIEGAVEYAEGLGFRPHKDYFKAKKIFGAINTAQCDTVFEFGRDGKPFYSSGPSESMERRRQIVEALQKRCGPGGFHYMVGIGDEDANAGYFDEEEPDDPDDEKYP